MEEAINNEINKEYIKAVECYEHEIENLSSGVKPDTFINLAFIYWCFAFELFEFIIPNGIPEYCSVLGGNRFPKILNLGLDKFPNNLELHFWKRYFFHIVYGREFSESECLDLINAYNYDQNYVPYFFLYQFDKEKYKVQRDILMVQIEKIPTAKNLYIKSLL